MDLNHAANPMSSRTIGAPKGLDESLDGVPVARPELNAILPPPTPSQEGISDAGFYGRAAARFSTQRNEMLASLHLIASQSVGADWTPEQALEFIKKEARAAIDKCQVGVQIAPVLLNRPKFDFEVIGSLEKTLDISTAHVLKADVDLLEQGHSPLSAYSYSEGFFLSTIAPDAGPEELRAHGFSDAFIDIVQSARSANIRWINLDAAGVGYDEIPQFEW